MKKIYLAPNTVIVTIRSERHLMDTSVIITGNSATTSDGVYNTDARRYKYNVWDDEEDDE